MMRFKHSRPLPPNTEKVYFSREQTRSMSMMEPIGDPYGYGQYNDPVSAALSISAMAGTYAAAGSFAAMTFAQGMIFAGSAISLAGNVTGNESLMKIGAGVAVIGGVTAGVQAFADNVMVDAPGIGGGDVPSPGSLASEGTIGNQVPQNLARTPTQQFANPSLNQTQVASAPGFTGGTGRIPTNIPANQNIAAFTDPSISMADKVMMSRDMAQVGQAAKEGSGFMNYINTNPGPAMIFASTLAPVAGSIADYASGKTAAEMDLLKADAEYKRAVARAKEEELLQQQQRAERINDPARYETSQGIINRNINLSRRPVMRTRRPV